MKTRLLLAAAIGLLVPVSAASAHAPEGGHWEWRSRSQLGVGTQNGPRYTLRFCRAFDGAHLAKRSERGGWRIGIGPEVIAGEIDMLPTER